MNNRLRILDIWVDPVNRESALNTIHAYLETGNRPHCVFASNPEKNFSVPKDPLLYQVFKEADLLLPDGIGMVLAARILHGVRLTRVPGVEFMESICEFASEMKKKVFVYGAREEVNKSAIETLKKRYPGLQIAGRSNGYVREEEMPDLIDRINESKSEILFLSLGSPKQEKWFAEHKHSLKSVRVCQGIGGTLDTIAGHVKRAPEIWQKCSAEWLYRLVSEPKRFSRQKVLPMFAFSVILAKIKTLLRSPDK